MSTTAPSLTPKALPSGVLIDTILKDVLLAGTLAASIFVKNPNHQQAAAQMIQAMNQLLQFLEPQLTGTPAA